MTAFIDRWEMTVPDASSVTVADRAARLPRGGAKEIAGTVRAGGFASRAVYAVNA